MKRNDLLTATLQTQIKIPDWYFEVFTSHEVEGGLVGKAVLVFEARKSGARRPWIVPSKRDKHRVIFDAAHFTSAELDPIVDDLWRMIGADLK